MSLEKKHEVKKSDRFKYKLGLFIVSNSNFSPKTFADEILDIGK